jgi:Domain of unknown function (DUF1824)
MAFPMADLNSSPVDLAAACQLLRQSDCLSTEQLDFAQLRQAVRQVADASEYQILGVCANDLTEGVAALVSYATAIGYQPRVDLPEIAGPVYIKFNPLSGLCYANSYDGSHRGVLISCQSAEPTEVNEMFGHLPLNLFQVEAPN